MGFLIDMLSYQRALAKKLFVYDEELGEFKPLMGREKQEVPLAVVPEIPVFLGFESTQTLKADELMPAHLTPVAIQSTAPMPVAITQADDADDDTELLDIFLDEAREVVQTGTSAIQALEQDPSNLADQTTLRRAFHTLKGS